VSGSNCAVAVPSLNSAIQKNLSGRYCNIGDS
jgi:hypothetical protein